jgi:tetratricopeptide (TPR) repeat protein
LANFQNEREQLAQLEWLFQEKKFAEGLARTEAVLREYPASFHIKSLRYKFLRQLHQDAAALQLLREMHAMSGDNIMVVKELADLHFQMKRFPESLLYYKKLLFLDSFNGLAQERLKLLAGMLEAGVSDHLADTKAEFRVDADLTRPVAPAGPTAPPQVPLAVAEVPRITFDAGEEAAAPAAAEVSPPPAHRADAEAPQITFGAWEEAAASPEAAVPPAASAELHYQTESAAELYFKQGLYREALAIYKNLFEKTGRTDHFLKIKAILQLQRADRQNRVIERLQLFLQLLQQRGTQIV